MVWGASNIRAYPWRYIDDPYKVLVSELMLHRTQVKQVVPIYTRFVEQCPTLFDFSTTDHQKVGELLSPLGLTWRIQGMQEALVTLWRTQQSVPVDYEKLISIPNIGQYIAGAVVCFTTNQVMTLIDSNIVRVAGRVFGLDLHGEARRRRSVIEAISAVVDPVQPRDFYYAMIDLAHKICRPGSPMCGDCPLVNIPCRFGTEYLSKLEQ